MAWTPVSPLSAMVRKPSNSNAHNAAHGKTIAESRRKDKLIRSLSLNSPKFPQIEQAGRVALAEVGGGAGPGVAPRQPADARADGVLLDVTQRSPVMIVVQRAREEAALPQVAGTGMELVDVLRIGEVGTSDGFREGVLLLRRGDDVDVVGHEAVAVNSEAVLCGGAFEKAEVGAAVVVNEEDVLLVVPALGDVVRAAGDNDSCGTRHGCTLHEAQAGRK